MILIFSVTEKMAISLFAGNFSTLNEFPALFKWWLPDREASIPGAPAAARFHRCAFTMTSAFTSIRYAYVTVMILFYDCP